MKTVIVDDERHACDLLALKLRQVQGSEWTIHFAHSVSEGIEVIGRVKPDLVFLDVQLQDGTGFDLLDALDETPFHLIFSTAFDDFAVRAFKYSAMDYLLKPVDNDELAAAIDRIEERMSSTKLGHLKSSYSSGRFDTIHLSGRDRDRVVPVESITHLQSDSNYTWFYFNDGTKLLTSRTLKYYSDLLPGDQFFRCHQSFLVHLQYVAEYDRKALELVLTTGEHVAVATRRKAELLQRLKG